MAIYANRFIRGYKRHFPATRRLAEVFGPAAAIDPLIALRQDISVALHLWPNEIDLVTPEGIGAVLAHLRRALRAQRRHARASHWTYDIARHARLIDLHRRVTAIEAKAPARV
ncbi:MAG: hypothetical protein KKB37_03365 [Alphaproteobacteria bacterium]|nr:hypothetical protein [Alphaproteobacteria bacterium]